MIFTPNHYPVETWDQYKHDGYKLCRYLALPANQIALIDAETFLLKGKDIFITSLMKGTQQEICVLAKIFAADGRAVCLRTDRDYFDIYIRDSEGTDTVAYWQFAYNLHGCRQDELWCNMADFLRS